MAQVQLFLSTPSARRATVIDGNNAVSYEISIHALREEGDFSRGRGSGSGRNFYPRPPRGGRLPARTDSYWPDKISIHALREEGDRPCDDIIGQLIKFLSTPSARRATFRWLSFVRCVIYFYPRPPRGGRPAATWHRRPPSNFYPRPPRGGRRFGYLEYDDPTQFLSTPSARRATYPHGRCHPDDDISIHALREEGDPQENSCPLKKISNFYPRPPRGGRRRAGRSKLPC